MKSLVDSGIHQLRQMKAVKMIIWDVIPYTLVVFCASIFYAENGGSPFL
jgi:hypothetical protein